MRIGELAKRTEVSRDTIRFYERHGLIASGTDPLADNNYRIYPEDAVLTLEVIKDAQAAGLSIAEITVFMGQFMAQDGTADGIDGFLAQKEAEIAARIDASQRFLELLRQTQAALARAPQDGLDEVSTDSASKAKPKT